MKIDEYIRIELISSLEILRDGCLKNIDTLQEEKEKTTDDFMKENLKGAIKIYEHRANKCNWLLEKLKRGSW